MTTTQLRHITPGATHKATAQAALEATADILDTRTCRDRLLLTINTVDGVRYGFDLAPLTDSTYSGWPAVMGPEDRSPRRLGPFDASNGVMLFRPPHPGANGSRGEHNARAFGLLSKRLNPAERSVSARGPLPRQGGARVARAGGGRRSRLVHRVAHPGRACPLIHVAGV